MIDDEDIHWLKVAQIHPLVEKFRKERDLLLKEGYTNSVNILLFNFLIFKIIYY